MPSPTKRFLRALAALLVACGAHPPTERAAQDATAPCAPGEAERLSVDVDVRCIATGVWLFTALAAEDFTYPRYPANGLLIEAEAPARSVLVDTGWSDAHSESLLAFARTRAHPIAAALVTHSHDDRLGGAGALLAHGVPVFATAETIALAERSREPVPDHVLLPGALGEIEWLFPGAAHSPDNLVVFHGPSRTLFGGCMIKALDAASLGNVADADDVSWPLAIDVVRAAFPDPLVVVPGHGAIGGPELLAHTASLLGRDECGVDADCVVSIDPLEPCSCCGCVPPRALGRTAAAERAETAQMSCLPICDHAVCAPCAEQQAQLTALRAACDRGVCVTRPTSQ